MYNKILMFKKMQNTSNPPSLFYIDNIQLSIGKYRSREPKGNLKLSEKRP